MFIIDDDSDKKLDSVTILLTRSEVKQLLGYAKQLLEETPSSDHFHLSNDDYQKEITLCMYDSDSIKHFHPKIQKLIKEDEQSRGQA